MANRTNHKPQKLTDEKVASIMRDLENGIKQRYLAMLHNVSQSTISQIWNGKIWK